MGGDSIMSCLVQIEPSDEEKVFVRAIRLLTSDERQLFPTWYLPERGAGGRPRHK